MKVEGAKGNRVAEVTEEGQFVIFGTAFQLVHYISHAHSEAYAFPLSDTSLTVTATGGIMWVLQNTSATDLIVKKFMLSMAQNQIVRLIRSPTIGTLGNETAITPANLNLKSNRDAECSCYGWDETGDGITGVTGGTSIYTMRSNTGGPAQVESDDALILGRQDVIALHVSGAGEFNGSFMFYYHEPTER